MKKFVTLFAVVVLCLFLSDRLRAQKSGTLFLQAGGAFPQSDFGDDDYDDLYDFYDEDEDLGFASPGITVGVTYLYPINENGFNFFGSLDLSLNNLSADYRDDIEDDVDSDTDITFAKYISAPITIGFAYQAVINNDLAFIAKAGVGINLLKITDDVWTEDDYEETISYDLSTKFGFKGSVGLVIKDTYTIDLSIVKASKQEIDGKFKYEYDGEIDTDKFDLKRDFGMMYLTVGIKLDALMK